MMFQPRKLLTQAQGLNFRAVCPQENHFYMEYIRTKY